MVSPQEPSLGVMMKGKRTKRPRPSSPALALGPDEGDSSSVDWAGPTRERSEEEEDMAHCLILLAQGSKPDNDDNNNNNNSNNNSNKGTTSLYECKTCNKSFPTFQALGGHRASHKKPKLGLNMDHQAKTSSPFFSLLDGKHNRYDHQLNEDEIALSLQMANATNTTTRPINSIGNNNKMKVHECSICGVAFSSGQALGGHMRRHRPIGGTPANSSQTLSSLNGSPSNEINNDQEKTRNFLSLDLNLPAPENDNNHHQHHQFEDSSYIFSSKEKTLVFATSSLVDCHY